MKATTEDETLTEQEALRQLDKHNELIKICQSRYSLSDFPALPTDILINSFMKSGTTLTQNLVYQLLCATGNIPDDPSGTNFRDISTVVPFADARHATGVLLPVHTGAIRAWKSHASVESAAVTLQAGRIIYCVRNGLDVARSFLDFTLEWVLGKQTRDEKTLRAIYFHFFMRDFLGLCRTESGEYVRDGNHIGEWFAHVKGWTNVKHQNVLFFIYEHAISDLEALVRQVARFLEIQVADDQVQLVASRCDRTVMAKDERFKDSLISQMMGWDASGGLRVREAHHHGFKDMPLPPLCHNMYHTMFADAFGFPSYEQLVDCLQRRNAALLSSRST